MSHPTPAPTLDVPPDEDRPEGWREVLASWGPMLAAIVLLRLFVFEPYRIPSGSMVPTLLIGDHVVVTRFAYGIWMPFKSIGIPFTSIGLDWENVELVDLADPERGDIIVFHFPQDEAVTYIKRVVGLPGDKIQVRDNQILLNGELQPRARVGQYEDQDDRCSVRRTTRWVETLDRVEGAPLNYGTLTQADRPGFLANHREITVPPDAVFVMGDNRDFSQDGRAWGFVRYNQIKGKAHAVWLSWNGCEGFPGAVRVDRIFKSLYAEPPAP